MKSKIMKSKELKIKECPNALFPFAFRVLNSIEDAKEVSQEVMADYLSSERKDVKNPRNYLIKSTINKSINLKKKNDKTLPLGSIKQEPISTRFADTNLNIEDIATMSFQILSNSLNINERAVFILKEAFNYNHYEIAEVLSISSENSRKILSRAKIKLRSIKFALPQKIDKATLSCLKSFVAAIKNRNISQLKKLLQEA
ncbi:hypothetical protein DKG77_03425 [Flagellimonas aquimarina]|uniref:RNA polymerase sigma factor 70 region 4 type 2 domain-containing protein n=1 Tax=Flagellimonas aquimarina TaxID=2201895 RepID=A0A316L1C6_9FLAO|nr:sigma factor-like helix-turn-helix DNA-binding protein [Allomuricauda koreensis]PWL39894.1 hypothetical protein DKG77_03425 [Allomuricauda koreensis]